MQQPGTAAPPRVLACLSQGPSANDVIRAAVRLAREQRAELLALHVEPPGAATRREPQLAASLERNLRYAADLGAQIHVVSSRSTAETIRRFAREHGVDWIVVGEAQRAGWRRLGHEDVLARLREQGGPTVIVARPDP